MSPPITNSQPSGVDLASSGQPTTALDPLDAKLKEAELKLKLAQIEATQKGHEQKAREIFLSPVTALATAVLMATAAYIWKSSDSAEKVTLATRQVEKELSDSRLREDALKRECAREAEIRKQADELVSVLKEQLSAANDSIQSKNSEILRAKTEVTKMTQTEVDLKAQNQALVVEREEIVAALAQVYLELNASDERLAEAKRDAKEHQEHLQKVQNSVSSITPEDNWVGTVFMRVMMSDVAAQGQEAAQKATQLTEKSYEARINAANGILKQSVAKHLPVQNSPLGNSVSEQVAPVPKALPVE